MGLWYGSMVPRQHSELEPSINRCFRNLRKWKSRILEAQHWTDAYQFRYFKNHEKV